jgi:hypothetical protein
MSRRVLLLCLVMGLPLGCAGGGASRGPRALPGGEHVQRQPTLRACATPPDARTRREAAAVVTITMTVTAEGRVDPTSISSRPLRYFRGQQAGSREAVERLRAREIFIREWAERNALSCIFDPATTNGFPVEAPVRIGFWYSP